MGKCLVIGSTVCDIMIYLDTLPGRQGDAHIEEQVWSVGGCAFNVTSVLHHLGIPYDFISPLGRGVYGDFVRSELARIGIESPVQLDGVNGCCYCFVEADGERTFLSDHGVEYQFDAVWLENYALDTYDFIYVCGLEVEEPTGRDLVDFLQEVTSPILFAPGPRGHLIEKSRLEALLDRSPILHLNEIEACQLAGVKELKEAISLLHRRKGQLVIVTQGEEGVLAYDGEWYQQVSYPSQVVDTIGAGDSHVGGFMAARSSGHTVAQSLDFANRVSSHVVSTKGIHLPSHLYKELKSYLKEP